MIMKKMKLAPLLGVCLSMVASVSLRDWDWGHAQGHLKGDQETTDKLFLVEAAHPKEDTTDQKACLNATAKLLEEVALLLPLCDSEPDREACRNATANLLKEGALHLPFCDSEHAQGYLKGEQETADKMFLVEVAHLKEATVHREAARKATAKLLEEMVSLKKAAAQQEANLRLVSQMTGGGESMRQWLARVGESSRIVLQFVFFTMKGHRFEDRNTAMERSMRSGIRHPFQTGDYSLLLQQG